MPLRGHCTSATIVPVSCVRRKDIVFQYQEDKIHIDKRVYLIYSNLKVKLSYQFTHNRSSCTHQFLLVQLLCILAGRR